MPTLREQLEDYLHGWRTDLSSAWADFFAAVEPDLDAIDAKLMSDPDRPVIPGRRGAPLAQAPIGAHVFRAFDGVTPDRISVVVIGQDPYPKVTRATGRAFEDGALTNWSDNVAVSLQRLMQSTVAHRYTRPDLAAAPDGWKHIQQLLGTGELELERPVDYFDRLQQQGVLFVNAGWTLTRFVPGGGTEQKCHIAMWRPLMHRLLNGLAEAENGVVFLQLGGFARNLFIGSGVEQAALTRPSMRHSMASVSHPHPNATGPHGYFAEPNPLAQVNESLEKMSVAPIAW